jgi:hypothetical protein
MLNYRKQELEPFRGLQIILSSRNAEVLYYAHYARVGDVSELTRL